MSSPQFYAGTVPAQAISTYVPEDRPYRIALEGWTVVAMNDQARTAYLSFADRDQANEFLEVVQGQLPTAVIEELALTSGREQP